MIARLLGPSGYGVYSLALVAPALLGSLIGLGVDYAVVRFPAKFEVENRRRRTLKSKRDAGRGLSDLMKVWVDGA